MAKRMQFTILNNKIKHENNKIKYVNTVNKVKISLTMSRLADGEEEKGYCWEVESPL